MGKAYEEAIEQLEVMEGIALRCIQYEHYFNLISNRKITSFWPLAQNAIGEAVCVSWAHLFGNKNDNFHFSNFFSLVSIREINEQYCLENIKKRLWHRVEMDELNYLNFWNEVKSCRDKFIAHKDLPEGGVKFPRINLCREMAEELRIIFSEIVCFYFEKYSEDKKLEYLKKYYNQYTNEHYKRYCQNTFQLGVIEMAKDPKNRINSESVK